MAKKKQNHPISITFLALAAACIFSFLFYQFLSVYDNQLTKKASLNKNGITLTDQTGIFFLVDGWEFYPDRLLAPIDFSVKNPTLSGYQTYTGEFPNLSAFHPIKKSPYGLSTYRIHFESKKLNSDAALYLPEILSASNVYLNGTLIQRAGNVSIQYYTPSFQESIHTFRPEKRNELIIQTANFSHLNGGVYYPPAIGDLRSISHMISSRMIFYSLLCFSSLALALLSIFIGSGKRGHNDSLLFYFSISAICFSLRMCYPLLRFSGFPFVHLIYTWKESVYLLELCFIIRILLLLCIPPKFHRLHSLASRYSVYLCIPTFIIPFFLLPDFSAVAIFYSAYLSMFKILAALFLFGIALYGSLKCSPFGHLLFFFVSIYSISCYQSIYGMDRYEPYFTCSPEGYASFFLILVFSCMMTKRSRLLLIENLHLTNHLQDEIQNRTQYLSILLQERKDLMAELVHDVKSPLTSLVNFSHIVHTNQILLDADTTAKLQVIEEKCNALSVRIRALQDFVTQDELPANLLRINLNQLLEDFYRDNKPVIEMSGPDFRMNLCSQNCMIRGDREKLFRVLENISFNAEDFTPPDGEILLALTCDAHSAYIAVSDTGSGIPAEYLDKVFDRFFTTRPEDYGQGLGLAIAKSIVTEHCGEISVTSIPDEKTTFTIKLPLSP